MSKRKIEINPQPLDLDVLHAAVYAAKAIRREAIKRQVDNDLPDLLGSFILWASDVLDQAQLDERDEQDD